jgi:hypothetical protein
MNARISRRARTVGRDHLRMGRTRRRRNQEESDVAALAQDLVVARSVDAQEPKTTAHQVCPRPYVLNSDVRVRSRQAPVTITS